MPKLKRPNPFAEPALVILISVVTLFLQLISFATTWSGSKVYLEGIFPFASLLFALAIQATAYFLSNSLRTRISRLKVIALFTALCCSTYYSYIGIYNSVNSPAVYLQKSYIQIADELTQLYTASLEDTAAMAGQAVGEAASLITSRYTALAKEQENIAACREALSGVKNTYSGSMRAPRQSDYENYEDYVAAYTVYIEGISTGSNTEKEAATLQVLSSYGFASIAALNETEVSNTAALNALEAALQTARAGAGDEFLLTLSTMQASLNNAVEAAKTGTAPDERAIAQLNCLFQAAALCGYEGNSVSTILHALQLCAQAASTPLLSSCQELTSSLPEAQITAGNTMELKSLMDAEVLSAILKINTLLPTEEQLSLTDSRFLITDLYLLPVKALLSSSTRMTALFCLFVAALIDGLSVLFAISLRKRKPLWGKHLLYGSTFADYVPQILASLPAKEAPQTALSAFLSCFGPSPQTEQDGYMLMAEKQELTGYFPLIALLCQLNLAKIVPSDFSGEEAETVLLKARFVFWANDVIYNNGISEMEVPA